MSTWKKFTKIDLRSAYQQMVLIKVSRQLCTINTHKRLFRYTRLPFGILSTAAIWQRFTEQVLAGLNGTCIVLNDLLVGSVKDDKHLCNLEAVFQQFQKYGLRVKLPYLLPEGYVGRITCGLSRHCPYEGVSKQLLLVAKCRFGNRTDCEKL